MDRRESSVTLPPATLTTGGPSSPRFQKSVGLALGSIQDTINAAFMSGNSEKEMEGLWLFAKALKRVSTAAVYFHPQHLLIGLCNGSDEIGRHFGL